MFDFGVLDRSFRGAEDLVNGCFLALLGAVLDFDGFKGEMGSELSELGSEARLLFGRAVLLPSLVRPLGEAQHLNYEDPSVIK